MSADKILTFEGVGIEYDVSRDISICNESVRRYKVRRDLETISSEINFSWSKAEIIGFPEGNVVIVKGLTGTIGTRERLNRFPNSVTENMRTKLPYIKQIRVGVNSLDEFHKAIGDQKSVNTGDPLWGDAKDVEVELTPRSNSKEADRTCPKPNRPLKRKHLPSDDDESASCSHSNTFHPVRKLNHELERSNSDIALQPKYHNKLCEIALEKLAEAESQRLKLEAKYKHRITLLERELKEERRARETAEKLLESARDASVLGMEIIRLKEKLATEENRKKKQMILIQQLSDTM